MNRINWIDNLRGMSILAVILLHSTIAVNGDAGHFSALTETLNQLLAPVRLGLMFFVSGLFVDAGLKKGFSPFLNNKVKSILYPFAIWTVIYGGLKIAFSSLANTPQSPLNIIVMHLSGGGDITWFLHSLFMFFIVIVVVRHLPVWVVLPAFWLASYFLPAIDADSLFSSFDNAHINKSLYLFIFFYLGDLLVRKQTAIPQMASSGTVLTLSLISFALLSLLNLSMRASPDQALLTPLALLSVPLFIWLAMKSRSRLVCYVGVNSIVFYLSHYLAIQFFSKVVRLEGTSPWIHDVKFVLAFLAALAMPWTLCLLRQRGWFNFLFSLKQPKQRAGMKTV